MIEMSITEREQAMRALFSRRLGALIDSRDLQQKELADAIGVNESSVGKWLLRKAMPRMGTIQKLADYFEVPKSYFLEEGKKEVVRKGNRIPVLGRVAAGIPIEAVQDIEDYEDIPASWGDPREYFALKIQGHSMEPRIWDGDVVIARKMPDVDSGSVAVVLVDGEEATVKQIKKSEDGMTLIGWNPAVYPPKFYTWAEVEKLPVQILGLVKEVRGKIT